MIDSPRGLCIGNLIKLVLDHKDLAKASFLYL